MPAAFATSHPRFDLVVCDIDGCLAPESSSPFDAAGLARIAEHNRGARERRDRPLLTVCSGRPQPYAEAMCRLVGNDRVPCVCENGVWLYDPAGNEYLIDPAITREHRAAVAEAQDWIESRYGPLGARGRERGAVTQQPGKAASISLYHPDPGYLRSICPEIEREFAARGWPMRVSMTWFYINCDLRHVSKSTGIERLLARTGIPAGRICGIGDTASDKAIADRAAAFFCPANAQPEVKSLAEYVSAHAEVGGVLDILGRL